MTRASLKKLIDVLPSPLVPADMYADPLMRSMHRIRDRAHKRLREDLLALYLDRTSTEDERRSGFDKASRRHDAALAKLRPLEERFDREVWIPHLKKSGVLRSLPAKSEKRRA